MAMIGGTRREMLRLSGGALALTAMPGRAGFSAERIRVVNGVVFEDRAGAGVRGPGDRGIPGVLVSNGRDFSSG